MAQGDIQKHQVARGETIIEIAKRYNVTPHDIHQANRDKIISLDDIKEGDILVIPTAKIQTHNIPSASQAIKASVPNTITYTVKKGETKFGLAKRFGITIAELERSNPHIVKGLNEGHVLSVMPSANYVPEARTETIVEKPATTISFDGYKSHLVLKGETLWGISHANGLTVAQLVGENTDVLNGILKEGQTLKIPQVRQDPNAPVSETYLVKPGDTKYGLSKKYETTIEELERLNPHIIRMLQAGHLLKIPQPNNRQLASDEPNAVPKETEKPVETVASVPTPTVTETIPTETIDPSAHSATDKKDKETVISQDTQAPLAYEDYEIQPKETLYGLSKKAGMTIKDFLELNPQLTQSVQSGAIIKMPTQAQKASNASQAINPVVHTSSKNADLIATLMTTKAQKILFVSPFDESSVAGLLNSKNLSKETDAFKKSNLEFYSGAMMAVDSIKKLGLEVTVDMLKIQNNNTLNPELPKPKDLIGYNAIFLPFYDALDDNVSMAVVEKNTPVLTLNTIDHRVNNNNLYATLPSISLMRKKMLDYLMSKNGNIIVVNDLNRTESRDFIAAYSPTATFVDIKKNGTFSENSLLSKLSKDKTNYVILDSERKGVFLNVTNILLSQLNEYQLQLAVLEPSLIPNSDDISSKRFTILKMLLPSLGAPASTSAFEKKYSNTYNFSATNTAMLGFDITFDTLLRLAQPLGFENNANSTVTEHTTLKFDYKKNKLGGYSNQGIYILYYDSGQNLKAVD